MSAGHRASPARAVAVRVLLRVAEQGAWATPTLDAEIRRAGLTPRDAGLASEITYGSLRALGSLDRTVDAHLTRGPKGVDPLTRAVLRTATYQIHHLSRVPPRAAVHEAVALVRAERGEGLARFVNAVLRRVAAGRPADPHPPERIESPPWLEEELVRSLGEARAACFVAARPLPPPLGLRVRPGGDGGRAALVARLRQGCPDADVREGTVSPDAVSVRRMGDPRQLPGHAEGRFVLQEEGAQVVGLALGARPGERIVDACAGRGGKTLQLLDLTDPGGQVTAVDLHERKLDRLGDELRRLGFDADRVDPRPVDLRVGTGGLGPDFDRVLVDAPCTNLGTLHRRPELLLRTGPADPARLADLQLAILGQAVRMVRPGGVLLYAVCSPTRAEGAGVADRFESGLGGLERDRAPLAGSGLPCDGDGVARIGPWSDDAGTCDAYQVVRWRVQGANWG
jgi:16S rRNA (cytosine967-C5)-methyltransferase